MRLDANCATADNDRQSQKTLDESSVEEVTLKVYERRADNRSVETLRQITGEQGFAVPEAVAAVAILGILVGAATGIWQSVADSRRVDSAAEQLAADLRLAHTRAVDQSQSWRIEYTVSGNGYRIASEAGDSTLRMLPEGTRILNSDVVPSDDRMTITFRPEGQADVVVADADLDNEIDTVVGSNDEIIERSVAVTPETSEVNLEPAR